MASHLGNHIRTARTARGWTPQVLAQKIGYRNQNKGARRVLALEQTGLDKIGILPNVINTLNLDRAKIADLIDQDKAQRLEAFERWVKKPIRPYLVVRWFPAFYTDIFLPKTIKSHVDAEAYASDFAVEKRVFVCLVWSRRYSTWINEKGEMYDRTEATAEGVNEPLMTVKGRRFRLPFITNRL